MGREVGAEAGVGVGAVAGWAKKTSLGQHLCAKAFNSIRKQTAQREVLPVCSSKCCMLLLLLQLQSLSSA